MRGQRRRPKDSRSFALNLWKGFRFGGGRALGGWNSRGSSGGSCDRRWLVPQRSAESSPAVVCDLVGLSGTTFEDNPKIPSVQLLNGQYQGRIKISNSQCSIEPDIASSETETIFLVSTKGGMTPSQSAAALPSWFTTFPTFGRNFASLSQQRRTNPHSESENPMAEAFPGLVGRTPRITFNAKSPIRTSRNGISPVRT